MRKVKSILSIVLVLCMLLSTIPVALAEEAGALTTHDVTIDANGVEFHVTVTGTESGWETGSCTGAMATSIASGKTLADVGVTVYHDSKHDAHLTGWQILLPTEQNGVVIPAPATDENGDELRLTTAEMLAYPIVEDTVFVPLWDSSKYTSFYWLTIHGNGGTFERTTQDSEKVEVRQMGYDSYPTTDSAATLKSIGILNLTDPVCEGKEFEGWVAYHHGPTDTAFGIPVTGEVLTTEYIMDYASLGLGYTDFIAKWKNEDIDPNNCPINDTNTLISSTPVDPTPTTYTVAIDACMGAPFNISAPPPLGNEEPSSYIGEATISVEAGTTLADLGVKVWHDDEHLPYFQGWTISTWNSTENYWESLKNPDGSLVKLDSNSMLNTPIDEDIRFEPSWQTYTVIFEDVDGGTFDVSAFDNIISDDTARSTWSVSYMHCLDILEFSDIKNGTETFYGWDVYESVADPNNPEASTLIPLEGPISTLDALTRPVTHNVVFRANWTGEVLEGSPAGDIDPANNIIIDSNNGSPFTLTDKDGYSATFPGYYGLNSNDFTEELTNFSDLGLVSIDLDDSTPFACWQVFRPVFDTDGSIIDWVIEKDEYGNDRILPAVDLILSWPINDGVKFVANWDTSGGAPGESAPVSAGLGISSNGGTFDIVRTGPQGQPETLEDIEHTRVDMDVHVGDTLADFGITDITDLKFWDGKRGFEGWHVYGMKTYTYEGGSYQQWALLSDKVYTTQEILAYPAVDTYTEFEAVWAGEESDYYTDIGFNAIGGYFTITEYDYSNGEPVALGTVPVQIAGNICLENDQPFGQQHGKDFYPNTDPVREGYTFEGWLAAPVDAYNHEMSDKLYTTEEVLKLPIPKGDVNYIAKWKEIPMEEYRLGDPYWPYEGQFAELILLTNGGEFEVTVVFDDGTETYTDTWLYLYTEEGMSFEEFQEKYPAFQRTIKLADKTNLEGWTTYVADRLYTVEVAKGDKLNLPAGNFTVMKAGEESYEQEDGEFFNTEIYLVMKNAQIYSTTMTPAEAVKLKGDKFYVSVAQWHEASTTLANVKAATCSAEGYTGDKVCAKCGEVLEKGKAIAKAAHVASATLANAKAATCTAEGYTGDKVCASCGEVLEKGKAIAKAAHVASPNLVNVKSATHTEEGYTGDTVCAGCGAVLAQGKVIDKVKETVSTPVINEEVKTSVDTQIETIVAVISGNKTEETKAVLTEGTDKAIEEAVTSGHVIGADIVFEQITQDDLTGAELETFQKESAAIEAKATEQISENAVVAEFIDISVVVKNRTTGEELGNITELDEPVMIEFRVPDALQAENRDFYIVHYHDGKADVIKGDYKDGVLKIAADKFSTYALVYADVPAPNPDVPATGDQSQLMRFTTLLFIAAAGLYLTSRKLRRA